MKNILYSLFILLLLSGCLQEPAQIDGIRNYYLSSDNGKSAINKKSRNMNSNGEYVFEDEVHNKSSDLKVIDPYVSKDIVEESNDVNFNLDNNINEIKQRKQVNWDDIFAEDSKKEVKAESSVIIKNDHVVSKDSKKIDVVSKSEIKKTQTETIRKPGAEIPIIKKTTKTEVERMTEAKKAHIVDNGIIERKAATTPIEKKENGVCCIKRPTHGSVVSKYGKSGDNELDDGMTFKVTDKNITSVGDGKVIYIDGENSSRKTLIVKHNNGLVVSYSYNGDIKTALNREVKAGQQLGTVSDDKNILYFTVRNNGKTIDPESIMK